MSSICRSLSKMKLLVVLFFCVLFMTTGIVHAASNSETLKPANNTKIIPVKPPLGKALIPKAALKPDLVVKKVELSNDCYLKLTVKNASKGELLDSYHRKGAVKVKVSGKPSKNYDLLFVMLDNQGVLKKPGGQVTYVSKIKISQTTFVKVDVDPKNMIPEFNETNNSSGNIKLVPRCIVQTLNKLPGIAISRPDLIIKSFSRYPENPTVTDEMVFTITIKNVGPGNSKACKLKVKVGGEGSPPRFDLPALAPGATYALRRHITLPVAQNYLSTVKIDDDDQNAETDETNNEQEMMFTVTPPPRPAGMGSDHSKH